MSVIPRAPKAITVNGWNQWTEREVEIACREHEEHDIAIEVDGTVVIVERDNVYRLVEFLSRWAAEFEGDDPPY